MPRSAWRWFRTRVWDRLRETWDRFQQDDGSLMAAAISFYAGISLMPLLIVIVAGLGLILESTQFGANAQQQVLAAIETEGSPLIRQQVEAVFRNVTRGALLSGPLGMLGMLIGAMAIFAQFERAFDRIWNVDTRRAKGFLKSLRYILLERFRAFLMVGALGVFVLAIFLAGLTVAAIEQFASRWWDVPAVLRTAGQWSASLALNAAAFTLLYKLLPKVKVRWRDALAGGVLVAAGWEFGRQILSRLLVHSRYVTAYGTIGSLLAILIWIYYASHLLFLGAEYIQVISRRSDS